MNADGTFRQEVLFRSTNRRYTTNGVWEFNSAKRQIILTGLLGVRDKFGRPQEEPVPLDGLVILPIIKSRRQVTIGDHPADYWADVYHKPFGSKKSAQGAERGSK